MKEERLKTINVVRETFSIECVWVSECMYVCLWHTFSLSLIDNFKELLTFLR